MSYTDLMRAVGGLLDSLGNKRANIDTKRAAKAYKKYSKEVISGFNYLSRYSKGDVCWVEFGNNLSPEMSYQHMGVILKKENRFFYIVPITTYDTAKPEHLNAYHGVDNPTGNNRFIKIKTIEHSFLQHDSVIKVEEIRPVSMKRIISKCGTIDVTSELFNKIIEFSLQHLFPTIDYELKCRKKENSKLKMQLHLANLRDTYIVKDFDDFVDQLSVPSQYIVGTNLPVAISSNTYEYILELTDEYKQKESKKIIYTIK